MRTLPILDVTALGADQLANAVRIFDETCALQLLPAHLIAKDHNRHVLDERLGVEVLNLPASLFVPDGPVDLLRHKMADEPSIYGHKTAEKARIESPGPI